MAVYTENQSLKMLAEWMATTEPVSDIDNPELLDACLKILPFVEDAAQHGSDDFRLALKTLKKALWV